MYRYFERNGKKILAVLGVFLMVAFIIPTGFRNQGGRTRGRAVGTLGKTTVYSNQIQEAKDEWGMLTQSRIYAGRSFAVSQMGVALAGLPGGQYNMPDRPGEIDRHPELFYLLSTEAEKQGVRVSDDLINTILQNELLTPGVNQALLRDAVRRVLLIGALHDRVASSVKISQPAMLRENAAAWQTVRLNLVEFNVGPFAKSVPAPTTQQVEHQFDEYKNVLPNVTPRPAGDPLGFGYEVPNRVKVQYIEVPRQQVIDAVRASKSTYDWDVAARIYYQENQQEFVREAPPTTAPAAATHPSTQASTQPNTGPSTGPSTLAASQPASQPVAAATGPTTRPYVEVKQEIMDKLMSPDADKLANEVADVIRKRLDAGYEAYARTQPTTEPAATRPSSSSGEAVANAPATQPAATQPALAAQTSPQPTASPTTQPSTQPADFGSFAFLESIAAEIQKQYKVLPGVHQIPEWQDSTELARLPGIGPSQTADGRFFAEYATDAAAFGPSAPSQTPPPSSNGPKLQLDQPSQTLSDTARNNYLFRLTGVSPAHAPELKDIVVRVTDDARAKEAYAAALESARKLLDQAKQAGLSAAAVAAHAPVVSTGNFRLSRPFIPNFIAGPAATSALVGKAKALYEEATPDHRHPVALVEMPSERKVVVAELADVSTDAGPSELFAVKLQALARERLRETEMLSQRWFNYDAVAARLGWKPDTSADKESGS
jgi:hypothetical protein